MGFQFADVDKEYKKHKDLLKKEDVNRLKDWYNKQLHLPKINELKLIFFLQNSDFNLEQTKIIIENYYQIKAKCPEFFTNRSYEAIKHCLDHVFIGMLPKQTPDGSTVSIIKLLDSNLEAFNFVNWVKMADMIITLNLMLNGTLNEHVFILDMEGTRIGHLLRLNLMAVQKYGVYVQEGVRAKIKEIHIINTSSLTEKFLTMIRPLVTKGLFDVIQVHSKMNTLFDFVPKDILPSEYDGNEVSIQELKNNINKTLQENDDYFQLEAKEVVDETKRIGKLVENPLFGFDGSFKQLNID